MGLGDFFKKVLKPISIVAPKVFMNGQTIAYPTERIVFYPRFRGRHRLLLDECINCGMCQRVCPCNSIQLVDMEGREKKYPQVDYSTCSFCGYCVEYCPKNAIVFTDLVEYSEYDRSNLVYPPERLTEVPDLKDILPMLKRRVERYRTEKEVKFRKVEDL
jgi:NAD(P)H-quinone oxidoreductase subunit I